ncbi:FHA domain-containing protein [Chloropicon primus]|uniref:E3 ubiquitin-protein ligase CHFR n=1 Tax=Chloropicon primus TaxID=1764295 RepID=A0A5B8MW62_9CHLO|nr:hypothetical protein A3770_11p62800 [Chloropicon primus]UPR02975.1 FHA domain-containing protein [Chloropicon primus]|eukprot:QDZ23762.1 hypothetical protein A3770_11p62800 [Chloropicon primus]
MAWSSGSVAPWLVRVSSSSAEEERHTVAPSEVPLLTLNDATVSTSSGTQRERILTVGRVKKNDVILHCKHLPGLVSRRHAQVRARWSGATTVAEGSSGGIAVELRDLGGCNGTFINGERVAKDVWSLVRKGDVVSFGGKEVIASGCETTANAFVYRLVEREGGCPVLEGEAAERVEKSEVQGPCCSSYKMRDTVLDQVEENFTCIICQDFLVGAQCVVPCGHMFCRSCLGPWLKRTRTCPICRQKCSAQVPVRGVDSFLESFLVPLLDASERKLFEERVREDKVPGKQKPQGGQPKKRKVGEVVDLTTPPPSTTRLPRGRDLAGLVYVPNF